jgi:hypothetical protein
MRKTSDRIYRKTAVMLASILSLLYPKTAACKRWTSLQMKIALISHEGPPLWSSGQTSWLKIRRTGFDSRHYLKKKLLGLERGPLSLVSTTEELLDRKVAAPV